MAAQVRECCEALDLDPGCVKARLLRARLSIAERESLAAPGAIAGTAAVRCDVAAPAITGATLLKTVFKIWLSLGDYFR